MHTRRFPVLLTVLLAVVLLAPAVQTQGRITPPQFTVGAKTYTAGDDYFLANYTQLREYFGKLAQESDRFKLVEIGKTAEGKPMIMAIITSAENHKKLARYKEIVQKLARADGLTEDEAHKLAAEGKAVVWIDGGLHATECINAQGLFTFSYQMTSQSDPETLRFLNDVIILLTPVNPDGMDLVSNWYMREPDEKRRSTGWLPVLYEKYAGHDDNRDSYMNNLPETAAVNHQLYVEWYPQIMYNQHQTGPAGTVLFVPPFRDPFNYNVDPMVPMGIDLVSASIHNRFLTEGKPGATMRTGASYSTWFNGGSRTTTGFHNMVGILTEIIGNPTPAPLGLVLDNQLPRQDLPMPIPPQTEWHQRQSIDYVMSVNRAILDVASKHREDFLFRAYRMGKNSIERGTRDNWTIQPDWIDEAKAQLAKDTGVAPAAAAAGAGRAGVDPKYYRGMLTPERRDPRGYILPADQADFNTATRFVNVLIKGGIEIHRATAAFTMNGKAYPAGSYVIKAAQAFRPHLRDMLEPQDHPNDFQYPGGPPRAPYDITGYTLAYQMGVKVDRVLDAFDGPFEKLPLTPVALGGGKVNAPAKGAVAGYLISHRLTDAFVATTRLLASKQDVYWLKSAFTAGTKTYEPGTIYVPAKPATKGLVDKLAADLGINVDTTAVKPTGDAFKLNPVRIGLWDQYGGSMPSGWIRYVLEQTYPIKFDVVFPPTLDAGDLAKKYDVLIFPGGAIPAAPGEPAGGGRGDFGGDAPPAAAGGRGGQAASPNIPAEYQGREGRITSAATVPVLKKFVEDGGTIIAIGSSTSIAGHFGLPVSNGLVEVVNGVERRLPNDKFYVPGSILAIQVDPANPLAYGFDSTVDVMWENDPALRLGPDAVLKGVKPVGWFATDRPLRSGWAWGQQYLKGLTAVADVSYGKGKVFLLAPEVTFRAQPHATFKFLFNGIYYGSAKTVTLPK
ncbi:MAG: M14 family metallopeptidase [Acidobacteria bacterium]|nr:M14 family metallopeptidase [Acidobacteriota bacterium]